MEENVSQKQKNKQTSLMIIGLAILVIGLVGITYAFFNYTRTGASNTIRVGKMAFSSNQTETINLTNVFPISSTDALTDTTNTDEAPSSNYHHKVITFEDPLDEAVTLTFTATGGNRFVVWGVNAEMSTDPYITAEDVDIDNDATSGSQPNKTPNKARITTLKTKI